MVVGGYDNDGNIEVMVVVDHHGSRNGSKGNMES